MRIGLVSTYPVSFATHGASGGVSAYTKNLVEAFRRTNPSSKIIIFANKVDSTQEESSNVVRCWKRNPLFPFELFKAIMKRRASIDVIHVQHEYFLYGNGITAILFPLLPLLLSPLGKPIITTIHGVIPLSTLDRNFAESNGLPKSPILLRSALLALTVAICRFCSATIVHENDQRSILVRDYHVESRRVRVIPHGVEVRSDSLAPRSAKTMLGVTQPRLLLFFGYLARYKGITTLIDAFAELKEDVYALIICGGSHPRLAGSKRYESFVQSLRTKAKSVSKRIVFTGFIPEDEIPTYFSAADLVVIPYTTGMSSSGPFSLALSYERPVLASAAYGASRKLPLIFSTGNPHSLASAVESFFTHQELARQASDVFHKMRTVQTWEFVADETLKLYQSLVEGWKPTIDGRSGSWPHS